MIWPQPQRYLKYALESQLSDAPDPDELLIDGRSFDPIRHFQSWRVRDEAHQAAKRDHAAMVIAALDKTEARTWHEKTAALNQAGITTHGGKIWTAYNLCKFWHLLD